MLVLKMLLAVYAFPLRSPLLHTHENKRTPSVKNTSGRTESQPFEEKGEEGSKRCVADAGPAQGAADADFGGIKSPSKASGVGTLSHKRLGLCHKVSVPF